MSSSSSTSLVNTTTITTTTTTTTAATKTDAKSMAVGVKSRKFVDAQKPPLQHRDDKTQDVRSEPERVEIAVIGAVDVGKTSILGRIVKRTFLATVSTLGVDFAVVWMMANHPLYDTRTCVSLIDTPGNEQYKFIVPQQLRIASVVLMVFDAAVKETFVALNKFADICDQTNKNCCRLLVANKIDAYCALEVEEQWMRTLDMRAEAERLGCTAGYFPVSAKDNQQSIDEMFVFAVDSAIANQRRLIAEVREAESNASGVRRQQPIVRLGGARGGATNTSAAERRTCKGCQQ